MNWVGGLVLLAFVIATEIYLGALLLLSFDRLVETRWLPVLRAPLGRLRWSVVPLAVLFIAVALLAGSIFPWMTHPPAPGSFLHFYLRPLFVLGRGAFIIFLWWILARWSREGGKERAALTLVALFFTGSFVFFDAIMSRQADWNSSILGALFISSSVLLVLTLAIMRTRTVDTAVLARLNSMHLALVGTWTYLAFEQYLIIWAANKPSEVQYFTARSGLAWIPIALGVFQFALPVAALLFRRVKTSPTLTQLFAANSVLWQLVFLWWAVNPGAAWQ